MGPCQALAFCDGRPIKFFRCSYKNRCCWALLAQFYPRKYPHNWRVLVLCLVAYLICTAVLNALLWFIERDTFLFTSSSQVCSLQPDQLDVSQGWTHYRAGRITLCVYFSPGCQFVPSPNLKDTAECR